MTVSSETKRSDYAGNGSTTEFATGFRFLENSHIKVILTDTSGNSTTQTEISQYTLTGAGLDSGGTVTFITPPASGFTVSIKRDIPLTQSTDYVDNDAFPAESHEDALDKLTMIAQQLQEEIDRSVKQEEAQAGSSVTLPSPLEDNILQWTADGNFRNINLASIGSLAVSNFALTYLDDADAATTRATLETKESFTDLDDSPSSYAGETGKAITVNGTEDGLSYTTLVDSFIGSTDTPSSFSGEAGKVVKVNSGESALEFVEDINGRKAAFWVNFDGTLVPSIRSSYNVTSVTDLGLGQYRINLSSAVSPSFAYFVTANSSEHRANASTTTSVDIVCGNSAGSLTDASIISVVGFAS